MNVKELSRAGRIALSVTTAAMIAAACDSDQGSTTTSPLTPTPSRVDAPISEKLHPDQLPTRKPLGSPTAIANPTEAPVPVATREKDKYYANLRGGESIKLSFSGSELMPKPNTRYSFTFKPGGNVDPNLNTDLNVLMDIESSGKSLLLTLFTDRSTGEMSHSYGFFIEANGRSFIEGSEPQISNGEWLAVDLDIEKDGTFALYQNRKLILRAAGVVQYEDKVDQSKIEFFTKNFKGQVQEIKVTDTAKGKDVLIYDFRQEHVQDGKIKDLSGNGFDGEIIGNMTFSNG